jgi:hypothetical protein
VSLPSLEERIEADSGGVLLADGACVSYALDAGALHAYDFAGERAAFGALVAALAAVAQAAFAAVIATTLYDDDPLVATLLALGFTVDWSEADVRDGQPASIVGLLREVS